MIRGHGSEAGIVPDFIGITNPELPRERARIFGGHLIDFGRPLAAVHAAFSTGRLPLQHEKL
jgi:hypothetical protein